MVAKHPFKTVRVVDTKHWRRGRFRILGGPKFRILGGGQGEGANSQQAHDVVMTSMRPTSFRRHVPTRFLINQCQIIIIKLKEKAGGLLGDQRVCCPPPSKIIGPPPAPPPPLPTPIQNPHLAMQKCLTFISSKDHNSDKTKSGSINNPHAQIYRITICMQCLRNIC